MKYGVRGTPEPHLSKDERERRRTEPRLTDLDRWENDGGKPTEPLAVDGVAIPERATDSAVGGFVGPSDVFSNVGLGAAIGYAYIKHAGQKDLQGQPFIGHPLRVMARLARTGLDDKFLITGVLHDVIEDCAVGHAEWVYLLNEIKEAWGPEVGDAVMLLSRPPDLQYFEYIKQCKANPIARLVKIADIEDNTDPLRGKLVSGLKKRYNKAIKLLTEST